MEGNSGSVCWVGVWGPGLLGLVLPASLAFNFV
jgi:hypothetical protein